MIKISGQNKLKKQNLALNILDCGSKRLYLKFILNYCVKVVFSEPQPLVLLVCYYMFYSGVLFQKKFLI